MQDETLQGAVFCRFLTEPEQKKLLGTIKKQSGDLAKRDHALFSLLISSGMRIGETLKTTVADAKAALETNYLFIPREHRKGGDRAKDHSVLLTNTVRAALRDLLELREGAELDEALIISRKSGGRGWKAISARAVEMRLAMWAGLAGLPKGVSPHWMRHTHAKNILRNSEAADPLRVAQASLAHLSRRSTEVYTRLDREELEQALVNTDAAISQRPRLRLRDLRKKFEGRVTR